MRQIGFFAIPRSWRAVVLAALLGPFVASSVRAQHEHSSNDFEAFVAAEGLAGPGQPHPRDDNEWFNADFIFGLTRDQFRAFGEYFVTPAERDLERLQLGYEFVPDTVLWLGRFQQPASAWNTEHHHGRYLQTSITRPSIESWQDEEGLIPQHATGALLESRIPVGSTAGIQVSAGAGAAPAFSNDGYQPFDLVNNHSGRHGVSLTGRLAYLPDDAGTSSAGLLAGHDQVYIRSPAALAIVRSDHATLGVYGPFTDWSFGVWRLIGAAYYVDVQLDRPSRDESFISAYFQAERQFAHALTVFSRIEDSARMRESKYIALFNDHSRDIDITLRRIAAGARWDYIRRQALSLELSHVVGLDQRAYEARLQWSAAIP